MEGIFLNIIGIVFSGLGLAGSDSTGMKVFNFLFLLANCVLFGFNLAKLD